MTNDGIFKILIGRCRKFLAPYFQLMDAWRQEFMPELFKGMIQARGLVVTEIARKLKRPDEDLEAVWQSLTVGGPLVGLGVTRTGTREHLHLNKIEAVPSARRWGLDRLRLNPPREICGGRSGNVRRQDQRSA